MLHLRLRELVARFTQFHPEARMNKVIVVLCTVIVIGILASCGSAAQGQAGPVIPTPTPTLAPAPTISPTPARTPAPPPKPTAAPQPTIPAPAAAPPILDLRPLSMSIVGHLDCNKNGAFVCFARVLSRPDAQSNLRWSAFTDVPGNIVFSPSSGVLAPGQSVLVTITVPLNACAPGLFFFRGPINTHTITWAC